MAWRGVRGRYSVELVRLERIRIARVSRSEDTKSDYKRALPVRLVSEYMKDSLSLPL